MMRKQSVVTEAYCSLFTTRIGTGGVVASEKGLLEIFLPFGNETGHGMRARFTSRYAVDLGENALTKQAAKLLARYFAGEAVLFDLPIDRSAFTTFQDRIYRVVGSIPYGEVKSYGRIAQDIGAPRAARGVGSAMARNPLPVIIPCHRVVGKSGAMTGYSAPGGVLSKRWLLEMERMGVQKKTRKNADISTGL
jgi:methylated-DNA-[protein]-cysteine S-methyltransferase